MTTKDDVRLMKQIYGEDSDEYITALADLPDEPAYQCDACDRVITEDERRGGIRGGGEGTFCSECCGEKDECAYIYRQVALTRCGRTRAQHRMLPGLGHGFFNPLHTAPTVAKHLFEPMPNDSVSCRVCDQVPSHEAHANVPVPAPELTSEWSYEVITDRYKIHDEHGEQVATADSEQAAVTIVANHHAAQVQAGLVEALDVAAKRLDFLANWIQNSYGGTNKDVELGRQYAIAARAALKAAGGGE